MSFLDQITAAFSGAAPKGAFRTHAWNEFRRLGLPERRHEAWKYTNLDAVMKQSWAHLPTEDELPSEVIMLRDKWKSEFDVLVIDHGRLRMDESLISDTTRSCLIEAELEPASFEDGFAHLHAALSQTPLHLRLARGQTLERPLLIIRWQAGNKSWVSSVVHFELGEGSTATLAEIFVGKGEYLRGELGFVKLGAGARLSWLRAQHESLEATHYGEVRVELGRDSALDVTQINAGARWSRSTLTADIDQTGGEANLRGLVFGKDRQHHDQRVVSNHRAAHTASSQLFKSVLRDQSRGILNGKIYIARDAQKVNSSQTNHSLLIGKGAEADTKPDLQIYADDVKANHGASIGRLDDDKIFYLQSRGLRAEEAERMLAQAFVGDVIMKIADETLRDLATDLSRGGY